MGFWSSRFSSQLRYNLIVPLVLFRHVTDYRVVHQCFAAVVIYTSWELYFLGNGVHAHHNVFCHGKVLSCILFVAGILHVFGKRILARDLFCLLYCVSCRRFFRSFNATVNATVYMFKIRKYWFYVAEVSSDSSFLSHGSVIRSGFSRIFLWKHVPPIAWLHDNVCFVALCPFEMRTDFRSYNTL